MAVPKVIPRRADDPSSRAESATTGQASPCSMTATAAPHASRPDAISRVCGRRPSSVVGHDQREVLSSMHSATVTVVAQPLSIASATPP